MTRTVDDVLQQAAQGQGAPVFDRQYIGDLDLRGRVVDQCLNLSGARVGRLDLTNATLRGGIAGYAARFAGPVLMRHCTIDGDIMMPCARFEDVVDVSFTTVSGRVYFWRARFQREARFFQLMCTAGAGQGDSYVHPGELNFSWSWFSGKAAFERCHLDGPVYFWRTRFLESCSFNETSFGADATFMGKVSEVCLSRDEMGWALFDCLDGAGLLRLDREQTAILADREVALFAQLKDVESLQELQRKMEDAQLPPDDRTALERQYQKHSGPMFSGQTSLEYLRIVQPRQVKFIAVNASEWALSGTNIDAIAFFNADQRPVPTIVGLGHIYDRVFISYGGPDEPNARRFNQALLKAGVETYYYPENALPGRMIDDEMRRGVETYDRILLICSRTSPERPGWIFELRHALARETVVGEGKVLLVVAIDNGLWTPWPAAAEPMRQHVLNRNIADFRTAVDDQSQFDEMLGRLLSGLRRNSD